MQLSKLLPLLTLSLVSSSLAIADDRDCSDLKDRQARQECAKHKSGKEVDCSTIDDANARRECVQRKQQNGIDCSKADTAELRRQCAKQKAK